MLHVIEEKDPSLEHLTQEEVNYFLRLPDYSPSSVCSSFSCYPLLELCPKEVDLRMKK